MNAGARLTTERDEEALLTLGAHGRVRTRTVTETAIRRTTQTLAAQLERRRLAHRSHRIELVLRELRSHRPGSGEHVGRRPQLERAIHEFQGLLDEVHTRLETLDRDRPAA